MGLIDPTTLSDLDDAISSFDTDDTQRVVDLGVADLQLSLRLTELGLNQSFFSPLTFHNRTFPDFSFHVTKDAGTEEMYPIIIILGDNGQPAEQVRLRNTPARIREVVADRVEEFAEYLLAIIQSL